MNLKKGLSKLLVASLSLVRNVEIKNYKMREFMLQTKYVKITWVNFMKSKLNFPPYSGVGSLIKEYKGQQV